MRVSPGPITRTCPSTNTAISEFVVPKSIPAIRSLIFFSCRPSAGHLHLRGAEHFSIPFVAASVDFEYGAVGNRGRFLPVDRVHPPGIERLAFAANLAHIEIPERLIQALESQFVPFRQRIERAGHRILPRLRSA